MENKWFTAVYDAGEKVLDILKFKVFKGSRIELFEGVNKTEVAVAMYVLGDDVFYNVFKNMLILKEMAFLKSEINALINPPPKEEKKKDITAPIQAPIIALFCKLIGDTGIIKMQKSIIDFCITVCKTYNLKYTDNVRQGFNTSDSISNRNKLIERILPNIDKETAETILCLIRENKESKTKFKNV